ncbi:MAG: BMP family ABC transporter substrate-binding protein, partial [Gemmatimonas sp.]
MRIGREVQGGTFQGRVISLGVKDDVVRLVLNPALASRVPAAAKAAADSVGVLLREGRFDAMKDLTMGADIAKPIATPAPKN